MSDIWPTVPPSGSGPDWPGTPPQRPVSQGPDALTSEERGRRWPRYWATAMVVVLIALVGSAVGLSVHESGKYLLFSVGNAPVVTADPACKGTSGNFSLPGGIPCVRLDVPASRAHHVDGRIFMVDVEVGQASPVDWAEWQLGLLGPHHEMAPVTEYSGATPPSQLTCQDAQQMASADQDAALAALTQLGYTGTVRQVGAQVYGVLSGTPAARAGVRCGDVITAVDGKVVDGATALTGILAPLAPGTAVTLKVKPSGTNGTRKLTVRLASPDRALRSRGFTGRSYMGVQVESKVALALPFPVSVDAGDIGGSSAGLAFTLAILDTLTNGKLTGGHYIGATGTIAPDGQVGDVSGVREKTVAVEKAGAQVFFVPVPELRTARQVAGPAMRVFGVTSLSQVLHILHTRYGGSLPTLATSGA